VRRRDVKAKSACSSPQAQQTIFQRQLGHDLLMETTMVAAFTSVGLDVLRTALLCPQFRVISR
jgi:hypothetical protein